MWNIFHSEIIVLQIPINSKFVYRRKCIITLQWKCPYSEFFWSIFSRILTEYGEIRTLRFQSEYGKIRTRVIQNTDTFYSVDFYWEPMLIYENIKELYFFITKFYQIHMGQSIQEWTKQILWKRLSSTKLLSPVLNTLSHIISILYWCSRSRDICYVARFSGMINNA